MGDRRRESAGLDRGGGAAQAAPRRRGRAPGGGRRGIGALVCGVLMLWLVACAASDVPSEIGDEILQDGNLLNGPIDADTVLAGDVVVRSLVQVAQGTTLAVAPGTHILFRDRADTVAGLSIAGVLRMVADSTAPIVLASAALAGSPGQWQGVEIDGGSAHLSHVEIHHARVGLRVRGGTATAVVDSSTIDSNSVCGVLVDLGRVELHGSSVSGERCGVQVEGGMAVVVGGAVSSPAVGYRGHGGVDSLRAAALSGASAMVLDGARRSRVSGCTLRGFDWGARLVNRVFDARIDSSTVTGGGVGILVIGSRSATLAGNRIENAWEAGIECRDAQVVVSGNVIDSCAAGIWLEGDGAVVEGNWIRGNRSHGVRVDGGQPRISGNTISGNGDYGLWSREYGVDARNNWWGDASGPRQELYNPGGVGDRVPRGARVEPWLTTPPG